MSEQVILVDSNDNETGFMEKLRAHREGQLHRAFSIFVFNNRGQLLMQKRAPGKYHSGGLWSNTVCSHPRPGELLDHAVHRRLMEEMGFDCEAREIFSSIYRAELNNQMIENEFDHIFIGEFNGTPKPDIQEAEDWKWMDIPELNRSCAQQKMNYTYWLCLLLNDVAPHIQSFREKSTAKACG